MRDIVALTTKSLVLSCSLQVVGAVQVHIDVLQTDEAQGRGSHRLARARQILLVVSALEGEELAALLAQRLDENLVRTGVRAAQQTGSRCRRGIGQTSQTGSRCRRGIGQTSQTGSRCRRDNRSDVTDRQPLQTG